MTRQPLTITDLGALAEVVARDPAPDAMFRAAEALAQRTIGHRLFTVMRLHAARAEVERVYSSRSEAYPVSGRKPKQGTEWGAKVLDRGKVFLAATPEEVARVCRSRTDLQPRDRRDLERADPVPRPLARHACRRPGE